jgi:hypothetical protein
MTENVAMPLHFTGSETDLELAGTAGADLSASAGTGDPSPRDTIHVSLDPSVPGDLALPPSGRPMDAAEGSGRVVATGDGPAWRHAPWPVHDRLFKLEAADDPASALIVGRDTERRDRVADTVFADGVDARLATDLTLAQLRGAATVVYLLAPDEPFPPKAFAVAAAKRLLLMTPVTPTFGLLEGIDHLASDDDGALARLAGAAARHPEAFEPIRAWGRLAAERQRASIVYARYVADIRMGI